MAKTYTIHNGAWVTMSRSELMELPWLHEAAVTGELLLFNSCIGIKIKHIQDGGSITTSGTKACPVYILKNIKESNRYRLVETYWDTESQAYSPLNTTDIKTAQCAIEKTTGLATPRGAIYRF